MEATTEGILCKFCNGFYDFGSEQPVCSTCHAFIYEFCSDTLTEPLLYDAKEASNDSGTEEPDRPSDLYPLSTYSDADANPSSSPENDIPGSFASVNHTSSGVIRTSNRICPSRSQHQHYAATTGCRLSNAVKSYLSFGDYHHSEVIDNSNTPTLERLPTEVLLHIFDKLDDMSLWSLRLASLRCRMVIDNEVPDQRWAEFVRFRWPLFSARHRITSWRLLYLNLMNSVTCRFCLERLHSPILFPVESPNLRFRRIVSEIKSLCSDPPYGIRALALDTETYSHCLAGIAGPPASPYEGGLFYVHILVPDSHPMRPPVIRFVTRILHPNISLHGDVGLDCIRHNWSLALTLDKLLISIQSLLTDPYTPVCMEPLVSALYTRDRSRFEELAKLWTWKFACHDYLSADFVASMVLPDYISSMQQQLNGKSPSSATVASSARSTVLIG